MTGHAFAMAMATLDVNGPEDDFLDWDAIRWRSVEKDVQRLRRRIFAATRAGDYQKGTVNLAPEMINSDLATAASSGIRPT